MENYMISIDAPIEAKSETEAIYKFRQWVAEVEASCFDIKFIEDDNNITPTPKLY